MRGKPSRRCSITAQRGITPARAGKTLAAGVRQRNGWDHPRACGENLALPSALCPSGGSPPRVRGKHVLLPAKMQPARITPARAGKTDRGGGARDRRKDHPRACGENEIPGDKPQRLVGSPPRVRGKLDRNAAQRGIHRITPARAGKTRRSPPCFPGYTDHPRACGENAERAMTGTTDLGSPPRVRGKPGQDRRAAPRDRITPARAGKTFTASTTFFTMEDHPRACGENVESWPDIVLLCGSPPRVRGKRGITAENILGLRITPARAGKTAGSGGNRPRERDHPRACGENSVVALTVMSITGSPPRVRGKH